MGNTSLRKRPTEETEVGIFESVTQAERAVRRLLECGFKHNQVTVICSDEKKERYFREFEHQEPAGSFTSQATVVGAAVGALLGGLPVVGAAIATGNVLLWVAGPATASALGVAGGLVGAMGTRGIEKELANYYQQAVTDGAILVAAEADGTDNPRSLARAADVFRELGARPLQLPAG